MSATRTPSNKEDHTFGYVDGDTPERKPGIAMFSFLLWGVSTLSYEG